MSSRPLSPAPVPPATISAVVPLVRTFRFLHEPVQSTSASRFVGRDGELSAFVERLIFSNGGSFLVTGYRGVGKTSFINLALSRLEEAVRAAEPVLGERTRIVSIALNIARPVQPAELMHYIVRRLYERLVEMDIFPLLDVDTREALRRAYDRTSFNMARKLSESSERSYGVGEAGLTNSVLGATAKLSWSEKRSRSQNYEMTFLGYDDRAAEHDIITIARALCAGYVEPMSRVRRFVQWLRREGGARLPRTALKIIFVFDELDKLEEFTVGEGDSRKPVIDDILGSLKNVFTTSGVTFVFVAGKDLQERWLDDVGKGDSVYESVFSFDRYLPCLWGDAFSICDQLVDLSSAPRTRAFERFKGFLAYKGRGIPRRIVRTFNEYVSWRENQPMLVFTRPQLNRITFFAGLHATLERHAQTLFGESREETTGTQSDKRRLGVYYLVDWMMRQGRNFTTAEVANASKKLSAKIALAEEIAPRVIEDVIRALVEGEYLQESTKLDEAVIGAPGAPTERRYEIPPRRVIEMGGTGSELEEDSQLLGSIGPSGDSDVGLTRIGKWRILEAIGEGGMGNVYRATDDAWLLVVAVKTVRGDLVANADILRRFEREAAVMKMVSHPNVVRFFEAGHADGRPYIVMEFLDGVTLHRVMDTLGKLELAVAVGIARQIADGMQCLHDKGIVRNDLKPANVMILPSGRVCLLDFGISKFAHEMEEAEEGPKGDPQGSMVNTGAGLVVGTPRYMAPELVERRPADARSDVYSLGVLLYQMLTRNLPFDGENAPQIFRAWHTTKPKPPSTYAEIPKAVDAVILRCLELEPEHRYTTMAELAEALKIAAGPLPPADIGPLAVRARERAQSLETWGRDSTLVHDPAESSNLDALTPLPFEVAKSAGPSKDVGTPAPIAPNVTPTAPPTAAAVREAASEYPVSGTPGRPRIVPLEIPYDFDISLEPDGDAFLLKPKETTFGRIAQNDIVILGQSISRYHGRFIIDGDQVFVEAFPTTNGVKIDGTPVVGRRALASGEEIEIGEVRFLFGK